MSTFPLRIGTPDGLLFEGDVERVVCRSVGGDLAILARHCNFCTALGMGEASVVMEDGTRRTAACIGGMLSVMNLPPSCYHMGMERRYRRRACAGSKKTRRRNDRQRRPHRPGI